jgi:hypothetical protein
MVAVALALIPAVAVIGCRSGRAGGDIAVMEPIPDITAVPTQIAAPDPSPTPVPLSASSLELADQAFETGDYAVALDGYRAHLDGDAASVDTDRALYRLALLHIANGAPVRDPATGYTLLRRLVREHPESHYRIEAELILGLNSRVDGLEGEIQRLESQLEALKRIDLGRSPDRRSP